ncbi:hypothetical protein L1987_35697 [Smallanthus sonchifolius]|uniref:Uncharacterized protein n=1 Tax=Smallanthus sonchifolius TaxID=185202 RepID=A0ACB9HBJ9_9ASTR|nr:hypothetical protein L1987_35697 [Smallanthus sonchifolius]
MLPLPAKADGVQNKANSAPSSVDPPPDIRSMVDKAATFLASIRPELEKRILADNDGMHEYSFLNSSDPYHAYYQHRVSEFRAQNGSADGNEKTDPFRPKRLTDVMRKSVWYDR